MAGRGFKSKSGAESGVNSPIPAVNSGASPSEAPALSLGMSIQYVAGVGPQRAVDFRRLGIETVGDLLRHIPYRYEYEQDETPIAGLHADCLVSTRGEVLWARPVRHGRLPRFEAEIEDDTGRLKVTWFNATYLRDRIHPGMMIRVVGKTKRYRNQLQMVNPKWTDLATTGESDESVPPSSPRKEAAAAKAVKDPGQLMLGSGETSAANRDVNPGRFRPMYHSSSELSSEQIERTVQSILHDALPLVQDHYPEAFLREKSLPALADAIRMAHEPTSEDEVAKARKRMVYD
jgi:ATP-dependent DNA helicase RecG